MKRLHFFILKSFIGPFIITFFIVLFVIVMQFLWKYVDDLVGKGLSLDVLSELLFYFSVSFIPLALPLAILLASLMTFGNLGEYYELTAIKAAGISLQRIMMPLIIIIALLSIGAFLFSNNVLPYVNKKSRILMYDIQQKRPELEIKPGTFTNGIAGYSIKIKEKDHKTNVLKNILIYDHSDDQGNTNVTVADSGVMRITNDKQYLLLTLFNGHRYIERTKKDEGRRKKEKRTFPFQQDIFKKQVIKLELEGLDLMRSDESIFGDNYSWMKIHELKASEDSLTKVFTNKTAYFTKSLLSRSFTQTYKPPGERNPRKPGKKTVQVPAYDLSSMTPQKASFILDSLIQSSELQRRSSVIARAKSLARDAKETIRASKDSIREQKKQIRKSQIEWHKKFTLSFACLIFFFIGAPLGAIIRKGGLGMPVVVSVIFFVLYYIIDMSALKFVKELKVGAIYGMWLSSAILLPLGIFLTYKATADSAIMNTDTYLNIFKKIYASKLFNRKANNPSA